MSAKKTFETHDFCFQGVYYCAGERVPRGGGAEVPGGGGFQNADLTPEHLATSQ